MKLTVIKSGSAANCYIIGNGNEQLVLEAGVHFKEVQKALNFNISGIKGVFISHEHMDHIKYVEQYLSMGIQCFTSEGTISKFPWKKDRRPTALKHRQLKKVGRFTVMPFNANHDAEEPFGYLIYHPITGRILFLTDSFYSKYRFNNLSHMLIEANFCQNIMEENIEAGLLHPSLRNRLLNSHMSIQSCKTMLSANDLTSVKNIVLLHLSSGNSDPEQFKSDIERHTGKLTYIAKPGLEINLTKTLF